LFKPSQEAEILLGSIQNNSGTFGFDLFWCDVMTGRGYGSVE